MSYIELPSYGSPFWQGPVENYADLPTSDPTYTIREVTSEGAIYYWDGATWNLVGTGISPSAVADTNSVDLTITGGTLTADVRLSSDVADAGYVLSEVAIRSGGSPGLRVQLSNLLIRGLFSGTAPLSYNSSTGAMSIPVATNLADGYLSSSDWSTFNSKQPVITPGTTADYYRGDKSFQTLNIAALQAITNGSSASTGQINEVLTASQATNTTSGVAVSGSFGAATSVALTAGRWRVEGNAGFNENGAVLTTAIQCGISSSATGVGISEFDTTIHPYLISSTSDALFPTPSVYVTISSPTTYYLNTRFYYSSGTPRHRGKITAIRIG